MLQGTQTCNVEVWDRPWLQLREFTNVMCTSTSGIYGATAGVGAAAGVSATSGVGAAAGMYVSDAPEDTFDTVCIAFAVVLCL